MRIPASSPGIHRRLLPRAGAALRAWIVLVVSVGAVTRAEPQAVLSLPAGEIPGRIVGAEVGADGALVTIHWQAPTFGEPFEIPLDGVSAIAFPTPIDALPASDAGAAWRIELAGGDHLIGRLESIDDHGIVVAIDPTGDPIRVPLRRDSIRKIVRHDGGTALVWNGTLDQLQTTTPADWQRKGSGLASTSPGAMLACAAGTEPRTRYDMTFSWTEPPVVRIALGSPLTPQGNAPGGATMALTGYRVEFADKALVVVRDAASADGRGQADVALCGDLPAHGLTLSVFIDRGAGRIAVVLPGATEPIADLSIRSPVTPPTNFPGGFLPDIDPDAADWRLDVVSGDVVLEKLRIAPWRDGMFSSADGEVGGVDLVDGGTIPGIAEGIAAGTTELVVRLPDGAARRVALDTVTTIRFPAAGGPIGGDPSKLRDRVRIGDRFGSSLTATLVSAREGSVTFLHPAIDGPVAVPIGILRSIDVIEGRSSDHPLPGRIGRLGLGESSHQGCLVPIDADPDAPGRGRIGWQPLGSLTSAPFAGQADGTAPPATITYRPAAKPTQDGRSVEMSFTSMLNFALSGGRPIAVDLTSNDSFGSVLILVTGESISCRIESIDEAGVRVRQEGAESVMVPAAVVKAVELVPTPGVTISPEKFRSLTTLPRSQQQAPPTHLVRSQRGDYLRGRLEGMDNETIRIAVEASSRGKPLVIPRSEVARVIWLHPETLEDQWQPPAIDLGPGLSVESFSEETLPGQRWRMRMSALAIEGNVLLGRHPVLGDTRIDVEKTDRLLIGGALVDSPIRPPFANWQLRPAPEPRNRPPSKPSTN